MADIDRYARQVRFRELGEEAQRRLMESRALVCGCGALGTVIANTLARAGVGALRIVDRDFVETTNLQRQVLFDEDDVAAQLPKAIAAANKLRRVNSQIDIEPIVADIDHTNILKLVEGVDCIVDGADNFETRFLVNDVAVKLGIPWVYGGAIGASGQTMTILPGDTPCLSCVITGPPPHGAGETCDTAGVLGPVVSVIASLQAMEAIKILSGHREAINRSLLAFDLWQNRMMPIKTDKLRESADCLTCVRHEFPWLSGELGARSAVLCGRNAVQVAQPAGERLSLDMLAKKLAGVGRVTRNPYLLRFEVEQITMTVFADGRAIVGGTDDIAPARPLYARYVGG
jgi:molybdopterin-synthase adenylyltransferase